MVRVVKQSMSLLALAAVLAIAVAACGSSSSSKAPAGNGGNGGLVQPTLVAPATGNGNGNGGSGIGNAASAFANINSYKFSMTMAGGSFGSSLSMLGGASGTGGSFTITGTIVVRPAKAADVTMGSFHIIEAGGQSCVDMGTGSFMCSPSTGTSMADSFAPASMFGSMTSSLGNDYKQVGTETKNGVSAAHFQGTAASYASLDSLAGVKDAVWTNDIWIAQDGGYPISAAIIGKSSDQMVFEFVFDITSVNDPANLVTLPKS